MIPVKTVFHVLNLSQRNDCRFRAYMPISCHYIFFYTILSRRKDSYRMKEAIVLTHSGLRPRYTNKNTRNIGDGGRRRPYF